MTCRPEDILTALNNWTGPALMYGDSRAVSVTALRSDLGCAGFEGAARAALRLRVIDAVYSDLPAADAVPVGNGYYATHLFTS